MSIKKILIESTLLIMLGTTVFAVTGTITNAQSGLILREQPSKSGAVITTVPNGTEVEIIEKLEEWFKVKYNNQEGYLFAEFVKENEEVPVFSELPEQVTETINNLVAKSEVNIYIMPQITSTVIATIPKDAQVQILEQVGNWSYITANNISGWVRTYRINNEKQIEEIPENPTEETPNILPEPEQPVQEPTEVPEETTTSILEKGYINVNSANVREQPSTDSKILTTLILNTGVTITEQTGDWYKINYQDTYIGYVSKDLISATQTTN